MNRKTHTSSLKLKVALEAIKNDLTIPQIVSKYSVATSLVHKWKKQLIDEGSSIFSRTTKATTISNTEINKLHRIIGKLKVENDFLEQVHAKLKR